MKMMFMSWTMLEEKRLSPGFAEKENLQFVETKIKRKIIFLNFILSKLGKERERMKKKMNEQKIIVNNCIFTFLFL